MTAWTLGAERVLLDASPFWHFARAGQLITMARYLDARACITREVDEELTLGRRRLPDLKTLSMLRWPREENRLALPPKRQRELLDIIRQLQEPGDHEMKHAGEVSTVLMAEELGGELVVLEDADGKRLARRRGVPRISTAMLAVEMAVTEHVAQDEAFKVYDQATPNGVGEAEWAAALERAKAELT